MHGLPLSYISGIVRLQTLDDKHKQLKMCIRDRSNILLRGLCNSQLLTCAPTGSIATMLGAVSYTHLVFLKVLLLLQNLYLKEAMEVRLADVKLTPLLHTVQRLKISDEKEYGKSSSFIPRSVLGI